MTSYQHRLDRRDLVMAIITAVIGVAALIVAIVGVYCILTTR